MSWFWRGAQSAVFYYLSCAPCSTFAHQRKRQKANRRAKAEKAALDAEAGIYQHPSPFHTNAYWQEEMMLGPGPPVKKGTKDKGKSDSMRRLNTAGPGGSAGASSADTTMVVSRTSDGLDEMHSWEGSSEGWNRRRYQRPDEALWGFLDPESTQREIIGLSTLGRPSTTSIGTYSTPPRNPLVNELHPPIIGAPPTDPSELRWMLQPPPSAKVMEGKIPANRSRSVSGGSSYGARKAADAPSIERHASCRQKEEPLELSRSKSSHTSRLKNSNNDRQPRTSSAYRQSDEADSSDDTDKASDSSVSRRRRSAKAITGGELGTSLSKSRKHRPVLSPINSSGPNVLSTSKSQRSHPPDSSEQASGLLTTVSASSSLRALEGLMPGLSTIATSQPSPSPSLEANVRLPSASLLEELDLAVPCIDTRFPSSENFKFPPMDVPVS